MAAELIQQPAGLAFDNASVWRNLTMWTSQHLGLPVNMTRYTPSLEDLILAGPRMVMKLGKLGAYIVLPNDYLDSFGAQHIPDATGGGNNAFTATMREAAVAVAVRGGGGSMTITEAAAQSAAALAAAAAAAGGEPDISTGFNFRFSMEGARSFGSIFSYATSKWALCCVAMAIILNRTHIFAATRRRLKLAWPVRLLIRSTPIILLLLQSVRILQSIQCQTSPDFAELRWGNTSKTSDLAFATPDAYLHGLSSTLLLGMSDEESCMAVNMIPVAGKKTRGSLTLLWPLFGTFSLSQFLEVVSCAVQGRAVATEVGLTIFEHSLAFAEAESAIGNQLGWPVFGGPPNMTIIKSAEGAEIALTRSMILSRVNTTPEVLLIAFLSSMSHVTSHVLAIFNRQPAYRLYTTGFWALAYMGSLMWSAVRFDLDNQGLLRYPTVVLIGFVPHVMVLLGIICCGSIYGLALGLSTLALPVKDSNGHLMTWRTRLTVAHANMQGNASLTNFRLSPAMDFYNALLRAGYGSITMASEAVYLSEDRLVNLKRWTWLEEDRYKEVEQLAWASAGTAGYPDELNGAMGLIPVDREKLGGGTGYSRERAQQKLPKSSTVDRRPVQRDGVGAAERSGRWLAALDYMMHINRLILLIWVRGMVKVFTAIGVSRTPKWMDKLIRRSKYSPASETHRTPATPTHEYAASSAGAVRIARKDDTDVESTMRRFLSNQYWPNETTREQHISERLYDWFLKGGFWGVVDTSGDYVPEDDETDFDATSVISASDAGHYDLSADDADHQAWTSDTEDSDGQRTPTQRSPYASRESTPIADLPFQQTDLIRLLHPRSPAERDEAKTLAAHLGSDLIMTRAGYKRFEQQQRSHVLLPGHLVRHANVMAKMTPEEEAQVLEQILLSRRGVSAPRDHGDSSPAAAAGIASSTSWASGAAGMGADGPQCVVCQSAPRTVIVWPCRCLSLCDDCRVSLAMNNFDKCVCCRREVWSFSRIFVP